MLYVLINPEGVLELHADNGDLPVGAVEITQDQHDALVAGTMTFTNGVVL